MFYNFVFFRFLNSKIESFFFYLSTNTRTVLRTFYFFSFQLIQLFCKITRKSLKNMKLIHGCIINFAFQIANSRSYLGAIWANSPRYLFTSLLDQKSNPRLRTSIILQKFPQRSQFIVKNQVYTYRQITAAFFVPGRHISNKVLQGLYFLLLLRAYGSDKRFFRRYFQSNDLRVPLYLRSDADICNTIVLHLLDAILSGIHDLYNGHVIPGLFVQVEFVCNVPGGERHCLLDRSTLPEIRIRSPIGFAFRVDETVSRRFALSQIVFHFFCLAQLLVAHKFASHLATGIVTFASTSNSTSSSIATAAIFSDTKPIDKCQFVDLNCFRILFRWLKMKEKIFIKLHVLVFGINFFR